MKIAWFTPFNLQSAIGRFSAGATRELVRRGHEVEIIETEVIHYREHHPTDLRLRSWQDVSASELSDHFDLIVVNIGDHYNFHGGIFPALDTLRCLGIFHDFYLYNLFCGWLAADNGARVARHDAEIIHTYGPHTLSLALCARTGAVDPAEIARHFPMTEWLAARCAGALAHAEFYADRLRSTCSGPIGVAHLAWQGRNIPPLPMRDRDHVVAITLGILNANKCVAEVTDAIGRSDILKAKLRYRLIGSIETSERTRLEEMARSHGYNGLSILGVADDATLEREIDQADILCCLRRPVLEGASASAIEAMLSGRPTVVADAGFYRELPDGMVFKVPADIDALILMKTLEQLVSDESLRRAAGIKARDWAADHFRFERYIDLLEPLVMQTVEVQPLLGLSHAVGRELSSLGLSPDDPTIDRLARVAQSLFATDPMGAQPEA